MLGQLLLYIFFLFFVFRLAVFQLGFAVLQLGQAVLIPRLGESALTVPASWSCGVSQVQ
ncbi:MAG: hypothetical protein ACLRZH_02610 [Ruthenibacterium lactatiformans]